MTLKLIVDRFEGDVGVCLDFEDKRYHVPKEILGELKVNDIFTVDYDGNSFSSPAFLKEETEAKKAEISQRMKKLFKICKNRRQI